MIQCSSSVCDLPHAGSIVSKSYENAIIAAWKLVLLKRFQWWTDDVMMIQWGSSVMILPDACDVACSFAASLMQVSTGHAWFKAAFSNTRWRHLSHNISSSQYETNVIISLVIMPFKRLILLLSAVNDLLGCYRSPQPITFSFGRI